MTATPVQQPRRSDRSEDAAPVDANVILRFLTGAPVEQAKRAGALFAAVDAGQIDLSLEDVVLAEVVWTLASYYRTPKDEIASLLLTLLASDGIHNPDKESLRLALVLFDEKNLDFADALLAARLLRRGRREVYSFDRDFDRVTGIVRCEPA